MPPESDPPAGTSAETPEAGAQGPLRAAAAPGAGGGGRPSFLAELRRRHVYQIGSAYVVAGWLLAQVVTQVLPVFNVSMVGQRVLVLILIAGFPVALVLAWLFDVTPAGIVRTGPLPAGGETPVAARGRRGMDRALNWLLGVLLVLTLGYVAAEHLFPRLRSGAAPTAGAPAGRGENAIAVLPFENLSAAPENAFFATGIQDEILTRMAGISSLKVISRTSTGKYPSHPDDLKAVAAALGVTAVLEGSVQRIGDGVHVTLQLIDTGSSAQLWAQSYDRQLKDVFAVEVEVAQTVADALRLKLLPDEHQRLAAVPTRNPDAYTHYLKAETFRRHESFVEAGAEYELALVADRGFADACAGYSLALSQQYFYRGRTEPAVIERSGELARQAVRLAPDLAQGHLALAAWHYRKDFNYAAALPEAEHALALQSSGVEVLSLIGIMYKRQGRFDQALSFFTRASRLDPLDAITLGETGIVLASQYRYAEAIELMRRARALDPALAWLYKQGGAYLLLSGQLDQAQAWLDSATAVERASGPYRQFRHSYLLARRRFAEAESVLGDWHPPDADDQMERCLMIALARFLAGNRDGAKKAVEPLYPAAQAAVARDPGIAWPHGDLATFELYLGHYATARAESHKQVELTPATLDAIDSAGSRTDLATIDALSGEREEAIALLRQLLSEPAGLHLSPADLRLSPLWDPLRGDRRFEALAAGRP